MDFKFSKDPEDRPNQAVDGGKGKQNVLLIVLLVLVGGFAYVYFFTGLIKPLKVQKPAEVQAPQVVKKPIPARDGEPVKVGAAATAPEVKKEAAGPAAGKPEPPKVAQASPAAAPVAKEIAKPKEESKKPEPAKPAEKKPLPVMTEKQEQKPAAAKGADKKTAPVEKKTPVAVEKKDVAVKKAADKEMAAGGEVKVKKAVAKSEKKPAAGTGQVSGDRWTVLVGSYLLEDALAVDLARVRKAGLEAAVIPGARKKTQMNRLFLAEYGDRSAAQAELEKLKRHTSDAFIMGHGGKHGVYAGSYLLNERALSEKERLAAAGFSLTLKRAEVAVPSKNLTAGTFNDKKSAESALKKLKAAGVKASLSRQ